MTKLLIEIPNAQDARLIMDFARRLDASILHLEASDEDAAFWETVSLSAIAQAYGDEEPDYELAEVKEPNPEYKPEQ